MFVIIYDYELELYYMFKKIILLYNEVLFKECFFILFGKKMDF